MKSSHVQDLMFLPYNWKNDRVKATIDIHDEIIFHAWMLSKDSSALVADYHFTRLECLAMEIVYVLTRDNSVVNNATQANAFV